MVFSPDGRILASCGADRTVKLWDAKTGGLVLELAHPAEVNGIAFSPDNLLLASGCGRKGVRCEEQEDTRVWGLATGQMRLVLHGHGAPVNDLVFIPGTNLLASAGGVQRSDCVDDPTVRIWNLETGEAVRTLHGHTGAVLCLVVVNGDLCSATHDGTVRVWNAKTGESLRVLPAGAECDEVRSLALNDQGTILFSGGTSRRVRAWDMTSWVPLWESEPLRAYVNSVACSADGRFVVWGEIHSAVRLRTIASGPPIARIDHETTRRPDIAFFPDDQRAVEVVDGRARVVDIDTGRILTACETVPSDAGEINAAAEEELLLLLDLVDRLGGYPISAVSAVAVSTDGERIAGGTFDGRVRVWDAESGGVLADRAVHAGIVRAVAFSPDGELIITGGHDRRVTVLDAALTEVASAGGDGWFANAVAFHPAAGPNRHIVAHSISPSSECYTWCATGAADPRLATRDGGTLDTPQADSDVDPETELVAAKSESDEPARGERPQDRIVVAVGEQWDAMESYAAHSDVIKAVVFSPDGRFFASAGHDGAVRAWRLSNGALVLEGRHRGGVDTVAFTPDGQILISGGRDRALRPWDLTTATCLNTIFFDEPILRVAAVDRDAGVEILIATVIGRFSRYEWGLVGLS